MCKQKFTNIKDNLISNAIWQVILYLILSLYISSSLLQKIKATILSSIQPFLEKYEISNNLVIILIFIAIETLIILLFIKVFDIKILKKSSDNSDINIEEDKIYTESKDIDQQDKENISDVEANNTDYYFENYTKHITVYKNGNGIIMNTFDIVINNNENFNEFKRKINVEDGKSTLAFPPLSKMKTTSKDRRFEEYGFWVYKPNDSIINSIIEKYWSDNDPEEIDHTSSKNPKELRWVFTIKKNKAKINKTHRIAYAISIPGLYPIEKGIFVKEVANEPEENGRSSTSIYVDHYIKKITYILSFEDGIKLIMEPECFSINGQRIPIHDFTMEEGIFYNKYIFTINSPSYGTNIIIKWTFKGGETMDKEGGD